MNENTQDQEQKKKILPSGVKQVDFRAYEKTVTEERGIRQKNKKTSLLASKIISAIGTIFGLLCGFFVIYLGYTLLTSKPPTP